jgi:positive regulator of sigma E activity
MGLLYFLAMANKKQTKNQPRIHTRAVAMGKRGYDKVFESDGTYLLKLVAFFLLSTFWVKFATPVTWLGVHMNAIPVGFLVGLLLVRRFETHQEDRKIWYAVMLVVTIICYYYSAGIIV